MMGCAQSFHLCHTKSCLLSSQYQTSTSREVDSDLSLFPILHQLRAIDNPAVRERSQLIAVPHTRHLADLCHSLTLYAWLFDNMDKLHTAWDIAGKASARWVQHISTCKQNVLAIGGRTLQPKARGPSNSSCHRASTGTWSSGGTSSQVE